MIRPTTKEPTNRADTAELLKEYSAVLYNAYALGEEIKKVYNIVPPKVLINDAWVLPGGAAGNRITLSLNIS
jgi:hypothetical protein